MSDITVDMEEIDEISTIDVKSSSGKTADQLPSAEGSESGESEGDKVSTNADNAEEKDLCEETLFPDSDDDKYIGEWQVSTSKKSKFNSKKRDTPVQEQPKQVDLQPKQVDKDNSNSIIDELTELIQDQNVVHVDSYKALRSLKFLRHQWKNLRFLKVKKVVGMGQCHIVINNKKESQQVYITEEEYEELYEEAKKENQHLNFAKSVTRTWEYGYYGWASFYDCEEYDENKYESVYFHYTNYAQMDFGISTGRNSTDGIETKFCINQYSECKTPQRGDFICGIVNNSCKFKNKLELSPFFVNSETFYRTVVCIMTDQKYKIYKGKKSEARLAASMICNGNDVLRKDYKKVMTPYNCEDIALHEHFVYMTIVMVLILNRRFKFSNLFTTVSPVGNLDYWEFILNLSDMKELSYLNNSSAICPKFEKINLRHFTSNLNEPRLDTRICTWGDYSEYDDEDKISPPIARGRQVSRVSGSRYKYNRAPYRRDTQAHEPFYEEARFDYGMTDASRAYNTIESNLYYQGGTYGSTRRRVERSGPYDREYEIDPDNIDGRNWADMTPPPSPTRCHKITMPSVYDT
ncbi:MAG: hypothetical protein CMB64_04840 [Euryarchaeota archaeon]|nr:hypothetical protein [Euryarchaeota archaeon]